MPGIMLIKMTEMVMSPTGTSNRRWACETRAKYMFFKKKSFCSVFSDEGKCGNSNQGPPVRRGNRFLLYRTFASLLGDFAHGSLNPLGSLPRSTASSPQPALVPYPSTPINSHAPTTPNATAPTAQLWRLHPIPTPRACARYLNQRRRSIRHGNAITKAMPHLAAAATAAV